MSHTCLHHAHSVEEIMATVDRLSADRRLRLTPARRAVLVALLGAPKALGAYDLLPVLEAAGLGSTPVVAYRALDYLVAEGLAHRIEGLNAFVACPHPEASHAPWFMVCRACRAVTEASNRTAVAPLDAAAAAAGFTIERQVVEAVGLCAACQGSEAASC